MTLKTCGLENCQPIEQIRGEMGRGDYFDVIASNPPGFAGATSESHLYGAQEGSKEAETAKFGHVVEMSEDGRSDFRICCKTCGKATPWNKADAPNMPGVGKTFTRDLWNARMEPR